MVIFDPMKDPAFSERYAITDRLGEGAMGVVFKARQLQFDRDVAIKFALHREESFIRRFRREGKLAARMDHPNLVKVYDGGEVDGCPYLVMEFVRGISLDQRLRRAGGRLGVEESVGIMQQILDGLGYLHAREAIHRDIKPANIFLGVDGLVKIGDFGLAWHAEASQLTRPAAVLGTPAFMAPEQFSGPVKEPTADIYSVGVLFYQLLTGRLPFQEATMLGYASAHRSKVPPLIRNLDPSLPRHLEDLVHMALQKNPLHRPRTTKHFRSLLDAGLASTQAGPDGAAAPRDPGTPDELDAVDPWAPDTGMNAPGIAPIQLRIEPETHGVAGSLSVREWLSLVVMLVGFILSSYFLHRRTASHARPADGLLTTPGIDSSVLEIRPAGPRPHG